MRFFVYVNENPTQKHIKIHCETNNPCGDILKQIIAQNVIPSNSISTLPPNTNTKEIIKFAETDNSYWLIIWAKNLQQLRNNPLLQNIAQRLQISIDLCDKCC